jgi:NADH dehydrogenase FAD-containing subunit
MEHIVIIGNGIAGVTLVDISEKIRFKITIVSAEHEFSFLVPLMYVLWDI